MFESELWFHKMAELTQAFFKIAVSLHNLEKNYSFCKYVLYIIFSLTYVIWGVRDSFKFNMHIYVFVSLGKKYVAFRHSGSGKNTWSPGQ